MRALEEDVSGGDPCAPHCTLWLAGGPTSSGLLLSEALVGSALRPRSHSFVPASRGPLPAASPTAAPLAFALPAGSRGRAAASWPPPPRCCCSKRERACLNMPSLEAGGLAALAGGLL